MIQKKRNGDTPIDKTYKYLQRVKHIDGMIQKKQEQIDDLRSRASSTALHTDSERVQSNGVKDKIGDCVSKVADLLIEIDANIDEFVDLKAEVMHSIDSLEDLEERRVLYCRYFQYMKYFKIAEEMNCSEETVYRLHRTAIRKLSKILFHEQN